MAQLYPIAGSKIHIGNAAINDSDADAVEGDFSALTYVEIKGWTQSGRNGDAAALITSDQINVSRTKKAKGTSNAGSMENTFDLIYDDPGQLALIAAQGTQDNYPFKVVHKNGATRYFYGLVMSSQEAGGGANTQHSMAGTIEINSNIVRVAPP